MNRDCSKIQCPVEETVAIFYVVDVVEMVRVARTGTESTGSEIKTRPKCSQLLNVVVLCVLLVENSWWRCKGSQLSL